MEFCICGHEKWQHWGDGTTWCALCRCNKFELDIEASKRYSSGAPIKLSEFTYTEGPMIEHRIIDESQKELIVSDINNPCGCAWLLRTGEQVAYCPAHVGDLRPATKSLPERIKEWREDDSQGFDGAIELLCEAEEELVRLNTPPSSDAGSPQEPEPELPAVFCLFHHVYTTDGCVHCIAEKVAASASRLDDRTEAPSIAASVVPSDFNRIESNERKRADSLIAPSGASLAPLEALKQKVERIVRGFEDEAMNGVICVPPAEEYMGVLWDAAPSRLWCKRCRERWNALRTLPAELAKLLPALQTAWATREQEIHKAAAEKAWAIATDPKFVGWYRDLAGRYAEDRDIEKHARRELEQENKRLSALLSSQAHAQEQLRWREIVVDGFPLDGALVSVWRAWPGQIRDTKFLDLRMPGPSWEGLYGWEPTHWRPNLSPVEMRALLTQKEPTP